MSVIKLTRELLEIPSPSGMEKEVGRYISTRLKGSFNPKIQKVGKSFNILAAIGEPKLLLTTHMDTVPKRLRVWENSKYIYGRGACDAKGAAAAMICAAEMALDNGYADFGVLLDVGEEVDFSGIKKAVKLVNPELVIIGEPTDFKLVVGQKGLLSLKITCKGKAAHGATPEKGESAIDAILDILQKLKGIDFPKDKLLGETSINIGTIGGGTARNVIADYAEASVELRTVKPNKDIIMAIEKAVPKKNIAIESSYDPVLNDIDDMRFRDLERITVPYFTEMYFWAKKSKVFVLGPGNPELAHTDMEAIGKKSLERAVETYYNIIKMNNER
jgi:acetylornithine deacetylase